ncbi:MAG: HAMP domain-containing sensor histidine kinase [Actinomycetaceae bacterium]|nr:HAMP domain-containing sensor histidine kinase [Actinomycetaceae bacterium]
MRWRALQMTVIAVLVAVICLAVPTGVYGSILIWRNGASSADGTAQQYSRTVDRRLVSGEPVTQAVINSWIRARPTDMKLVVLLPDGRTLTGGNIETSFAHHASFSSLAGATIRVTISGEPEIKQIAAFISILLTGATLSLMVGWALALRGSRRISAPLIYLAAQAEQLGSGTVRAQVKPSGIEEIDLVQAELQRTGERLAGRLAAERQFSADASHQLRTPLTALSMRLEEIEIITTEDEVREEAKVCLEQVERLTGVIEDLLKTSRQSSGGTTQAINVSKVFEQQEREWGPAFKKAKRTLAFIDESDRPALVTPGTLGQALATVIENSLKYGDGTTTVTARMDTTKHGIFIEILDEGVGVDEEIAADIFLKGVSGFGSTGIGLALAKQLIEADGGRIELAQRVPPLFSIYVAAIPASLDPNKVLPRGAMVSVSPRKRRFTG